MSRWPVVAGGAIPTLEQGIAGAPPRRDPGGVPSCRSKAERVMTNPP